MADYTARVGQRPKTNVTPVASAYVSEVDSANHTVTLTTQNGYPITAYYYSPYPISASQTVHYVTDTQGNYVVVGSPATEQKTSLFANVQRTTSATAQSASTTLFNVDFDSVISDDYSMWGATNNEYTVPVDGVYSMTASLGFDNSVSNTGIRGIYITKNGGTNIALNRCAPQNASLNTDTYLNVSCIAPLAAGDTVSVRAYSNASVTLLSNTIVNFSIIYVGNY